MSSGRLKRQVTMKPLEDLIIIDSDDEDEVIFVNDDGGKALSETTPVVTPGFLENLPNKSEPEVRSLFDNIIKIPAEPEDNPIVIERTFTVSPSNQFEEEQIEFSNYNVQVLKSDEEASTSKPLIKLAPLSKLVDSKTFISLDQIVNNLGVSAPQPKTKKYVKKTDNKVVKTKAPKCKSKIVYKNSTVFKKAFTKSDLSEKIDMVKKFLPSSSSVGCSREDILRQTLNFVMELRKSDCELDIAEEALLQTNIKLTMDFERILHKVYSLCPSYQVEEQPVKKTRYNSNKDVSLGEKENSINDKVPDEVTSATSIDDQPKSSSSSEECSVLNNLMNEVQESAKSHLLNFDPDVPFNEFLPPTLLKWDQPKTKTDLLDEIMYLENAISKCTSETDEIRKVSQDQEIFKYEDLVSTFNKEFDLGVEQVNRNSYNELINDCEDSGKDILDETSAKNEIKAEDTAVKINQEPSTEPSKDLEEVLEKSEKKEVKVTTPTRRKKKVPWNKGKKTGVRRKLDKAMDEGVSNVVPIEINVDPVGIDVEPVVIDLPVKEPTDNPPDEVPDDKFQKSLIEVSNNLNESSFQQIKPKMTKRKKNKKWNGVKSRTSIKRSCKNSGVTDQTFNLDTSELVLDEKLDDNWIRSDKSEPALDEKLDKTWIRADKSEPVLDEKLDKTDEQLHTSNIEDDDETPLNIILERRKMPILKLVREKVGNTARIVINNDPPSIKKDEPIKDEPIKRKKTLRPKFTEGARTTRSFVKKCSEVMNEIDEEMQEFLKKDKIIDSDSDNSNGCVSDNETSVSVAGTDVNTDDILENSIKPLSEPEIDIKNAEDTLDKSFETPVDVMKKVSPKKKKKYYSGKTKRRYRKGKASKKMVESTDKLVSVGEGIGKFTDFESSIDQTNPSINIDTQVSDNTSGSLQIISNCFSIDPSQFDNMDEGNGEDFKQKDDECSASETAENLSKEAKSLIPTVEENDVPLVIDSPSSPLALTVDKNSGGPNKDNEVLDKIDNDDAPLDFSKKSISKSGPEMEETCLENTTAPLNLSYKSTDLTVSPNNLVIDFSIKSKNSSAKDEVISTNQPVLNTEPVEAFDLTKTNSCVDNLKNSPRNYPPVTSIVDKPKTPYDSGKQIFSNPKDFIVTPPIAPSKSTDHNEPFSISDSPLSPVKDNIINEITDILVDLTEQTPSEQVNFNLERSTSSDKTASQVSISSPAGNTRFDDLNIPNAQDVHSKSSYQRQNINAPPLTTSDNSKPFTNNPQNVQDVPSYCYSLQEQIDERSCVKSSASDVRSTTIANVMPVQNMPNYPAMSVLGNNHVQSYPAGNVMISQPNPGFNQALVPFNASRQGVFGGNQQTMPGFGQQSRFGFETNCSELVSLNDPRLQRQVDQVPDIYKQMVPISQQQVIPNLRDPRVTRKLMADGSFASNAETPFSGNIQINQLISEVIKHNNFETFLMNSKTNQMIMNQNLDLDEEDLNLNRSDFDDFDDSDEAENEEKQRQNLLRKSIDKLISTDLKEQSVLPTSDSTMKRESDSSDESYQDSSFTRRVLKSPPMIKKDKEDDNNLSDEAEISYKTKGKMDFQEDKISKRCKSKVKYTDDLSENSQNSFVEEPPVSKAKKRLSLQKYLNRQQEKRLKDKHKKSFSGSDDEYSPVRKASSSNKRSRKRVIDSEEDSDLSDHHSEVENDGKVNEGKSEFKEEVSDHLKRVSNIKHRKLEGKEKKIISIKRDPRIRQMKFLDELPDTDVHNDSMPPLSKKHEDKRSKIDKSLSHKRDDSPKSTSRIVRKTITTERIVTKRIGGDSSSIKISKRSPDKEKKVFVQERITLKVNEKSNLDRKGGINFKCDALKEGEILKVVGGKLVRVKKKVSNSDEELERERSKLQKCLHSFKIKKKTDKNLFEDDNPYSVLKEDKANDVKKMKEIECPRSKRYSEELKVETPSKKSLSDMGRASSHESIDSEVKKSPIPMRISDPRRLSREAISSPRYSSPSTTSSPNVAHDNKTSSALVERPNMNVARYEAGALGDKTSKVDPFPKSSPLNQPESNHGMEVATKPNLELIRSCGVPPIINSAYTSWSNMELSKNASKTSHVEVSQFNNDEFSKRTNMEMVNRPDMDVARKSNFQPDRCGDPDSNRHLNTRPSNEIFTRRESFTKVERRRSRDGAFSSRESRQETSFTSEWTSRESGERSILSMFQRGEIKIWEGQNKNNNNNNNNMRQNQSEPHGNFSRQRNNSWNEPGRCNDLDIPPWHNKRDLHPYPPRDEPGEQFVNQRNQRHFRGPPPDDRNSRNPNNMFRGPRNEDGGPPHNDIPCRGPQFYNINNNDGRFRDRDDRLRDQDERMRDWNRDRPPQGWTPNQERCRRDFAGNWQNDSPSIERLKNDPRFREDRDYRRNEWHPPNNIPPRMNNMPPERTTSPPRCSWQ